MNKFAILLECDPGNTLGGSCLHDVSNMAHALIQKCQFDPKDIYILATAVCQNKIDHINYDISKNFFKVSDQIYQLNPNFLLILISGHGFSVTDTDGDEVDHMDDAINVGYQITDDNIYDCIVKKFNCQLMLFGDTCHSGTLFDLPYFWDETQWQLDTNRRDDLNCQGISISACSDNELSMCDIGDETGFGGSLTTALLNIEDILEDLVNFRNILSSYEKIKSRLKLLNQDVVLESSNMHMNIQ
jgi:Caspase domain